MSTLAAPLASPYYEGASLVSTVPGVYDCALAGIPLMIDWKFADQMRRRSITLLKPQQDQSGNLGEQSLNPEEFGRRAQESWHHGAGQTFLDAGDFDPFRFRTSKGVDVWTKKELSLLADTAQKRSSANTNLALVPAGARLYLLDGTAVRYTADVTAGSPTWTAVTGLPATAGTGMASDGFTVFTTHAADGIYSTNTGTGASGSYNTRAANGICGYVMGRLIVSNNNVLVNITGAATETILLTHPNSDFRWVGVAEGPGFIYAAGYSGDKSLIYRVTIKDDATALDAPVVAGSLPDGEIVRSIVGYLGYLMVGTDKGWRLVAVNDAGDISTMSDLVPTSSAVRCFEPQDHYLWFGLTNYDGQSTGLGRADLGVFTKGITPAYASDLMATVQGAVLSAATFQNVRAFAVSGQGVYAEIADRVPTGTIDSGLVTFNLPDTKVAEWLDLRHEMLAGTVTAGLAADGGAFVALGSSTDAGSTSTVIAVGHLRGQTHEVRLTLARAAAATTGPTVHRWTLEANPAPGRGEVNEVAFLLFESVQDAQGNDKPMDVASVYRSLLSIETIGAPVSYVDGFGSSVVFLDDHEFAPHDYTAERDAFNGTFLARLRRPRTRP